MNFDHQLSLNKIRDFLRRNDFNGYVLEILQFANHPIKNRSDENTKLILEFNSLVLTEERRVIYNEYANILDKNLQWIRAYFVDHILGQDHESKIAGLTENLASLLLKHYPHITIAKKSVKNLLNGILLQIEHIVIAQKLSYTMRKNLGILPLLRKRQPCMMGGEFYIL